MAKSSKSSPLFILAAIVTAVATLYFAKEIVLPISLAILLTFLLTPLANRLESWRIPRTLSAVLVVAISFSVLGLLGWIVTVQLVDVGRQLPANKENLISKTKWISETANKVLNEVSRFGKLHQPPAEATAASDQKPSAADATTQKKTQPKEKSPDLSTPIASDARKIDEAGEIMETPAEREAAPVRIVGPSTSPLEFIKGWLGPILSPFATAFIVIVLTLFMLLDREGQRSRLIQLFGRSHFHETTEAVHDVAQRVGAYLRSLFLVNAGYGFAIFLGLSIIGVPNAMLWGVLAFALRFLPYLGPWIAAAMPILISIATSSGWTQPLIVFGLYVVAELIVYNVVEPFVYGSVIGVSTVGILVSALFWTWLWGPIGLLLAMPMTVCLLVAARYVPQLRFIAVLLGDESTSSPSEHVYQRLLAFDYHEPLKQAQKHLKESSLISYYDGVLLPALRMAAHDRHGDLLNEDQNSFVIEATEDLVQELGDEAFAAISSKADGDAKPPLAISSVGTNGETMTARVLCVPLRDDADETASHMLAQLLVAEGFDVVTEGAKSLASQVVDRVADSESEVVVISAMPPLQPRDSRLLWKRLRNRYPDLPIIVGFWTSSDNKNDLPSPDDDTVSKVATTLAEAVALVRTMATQARLKTNEPPHAHAG
jgi:predicted PurR-regulated permease PerM/methylmalonyl-CoA mutase cobalamin-binding subunit